MLLAFRQVRHIHIFIYFFYHNIGTGSTGRTEGMAMAQAQTQNPNSQARLTGNSVAATSYILAHNDPIAMAKRLMVDKAIRTKDQFENITAALEQKGFYQVHDSVLVKENERIFNRSAGAQSNFFVFVRNDPHTGKVSVEYYNPAIGPDADKLPTKEVVVVSDSRGADLTWADRIANRIAEVAAAKPDNVYFGCMHGHWGFVKDRALVPSIDDGLSHDYDVIRQMMLYHIDYDATGPHNHILPGLDYVTQMEKNVGIVKIPGFELTLPFAPGARNGPHHNIWMADMDTVNSVNDTILKQRSGNYPPFAPLGDPDTIIRQLRDFSMQGRLAIGVAHPAGNLDLPGVGLLNRIAEGDFELYRALEKTKSYAHAIGFFNQTNNNEVLKFTNPSEQEWALRIVNEHKMMKPALNSLCIAFALEMAKSGLWPYSDNDSHNSHPVNFKSQVDNLGQGHTRITFSEAFLKGRKEKPGAADVVRFISTVKSTDNSPDFGMVPYIHYDMRKGYASVVAPRLRPFLERAGDKVQDLASYIKRVPTLLHDIWDGAKSVLR